MRRYGSVLCATAALVLALAPACVERAGRDDDAAFRTDLRLRWTPQSQFAGIYVAEEQGIFADHRLEVDVHPSGPGVNFMQLVGTGAEEFGIGGAAQIIEARDRGLPVVALAVIFQGNPNVFFAMEDTGITGPEDWAGRSVAVYHGYDLEYMYHAMLARAGLDRDQVVEYPATIDMTPFFNREVDVWAGYLINQPNTAEERGYDITRILPGDYGINVSGDTLYTTESVIREKPDLVQRMTNAVLEGWQVALADTEAAVATVLDREPRLDVVHERKMIDAVHELAQPEALGGRIGWMTREQWQEMVDLWREFGGIENDVDAARCFDDTFVRAYYADGGARWTR